MTLKSSRAKKILLLVILLAGTWMRFYRLPSTLMFQGDQGRDAIIVKRLIKDRDPVLIGPVTSVGNMYLGPFYYYFMAPWLWLTYPNPIGPAYGVAILSVITIGIIYAVGRRLMGETAAFIATFLVTFMNPAIQASRFSWNPNLAPLLSVFIIWSLDKAFREHRYGYLILTGIGFGLLTQLHYMALIMGPIIVILVGLGWLSQKPQRPKILAYSLLSLGVYALSWLPLIAFDLTHQGLIHQNFLAFFSGKESPTVSITYPPELIPRIEQRGLHLLARYLGAPESVADRIIMYAGLCGLGLLLATNRVKLKQEPGLVIALAGILTTVLISAFYHESVYDHYLLFAIPFVVYFWGFLLARVGQFFPVGKVFVGIGLVLFLVYNLTHATTFARAAPSIATYKRVAEAIYPHLKATPYNLALLTESKDYKGMNYRYFLETTPHPPQSPDDYRNLRQLVVIDELQVIDPLTVNLYEVQEPGLKKLVNTFRLPNGPSVYFYE